MHIKLYKVGEKVLRTVNRKFLWETANGASIVSLQKPSFGLFIFKSEDQETNQTMRRTYVCHQNFGQLFKTEDLTVVYTTVMDGLYKRKIAGVQNLELTQHQA